YFPDDLTRNVSQYQRMKLTPLTAASTTSNMMIRLCAFIVEDSFLGCGSRSTVNQQRVVIVGPTRQRDLRLQLPLEVELLKELECRAVRNIANYSDTFAAKLVEAVECQRLTGRRTAQEEGVTGMLAHHVVATLLDVRERLGVRVEVLVGCAAGCVC